MDEFNQQINEELYASYLYLAMSADMSDKGWDGMAQWFKKQAEEEIVHAFKFYNHIQERNGRVELKAIKQPQTEWESPLSAFKSAYEHEKYVTGRIHHLYKLAEEEKDYASYTLLNWFEEEQIEEEEQTLKIVDMLEKIGTHTNQLFMLDSQLGRRE